MIKPPSQQHEYTLIYSGDPALNLPSLASIESLPESDQADALAARVKALEVAWETGRWDALIIPGESPTIFHVRPIVGALVDWLGGEHERRSLTNAELQVLALRIALRKIDNFGGHKVKLRLVDGHQLAHEDTIAALYEVPEAGREIVQELGRLVLMRAFGFTRPKS